MRLLLALVRSHAKVAGASKGPAAIGKAAPGWAPAFVRAPPAELLPFIRGLISYPVGADVARHFTQQMLGTLGRCLLHGTCQWLQPQGGRALAYGCDPRLMGPLPPPPRPLQAS